MRIARRYRIEPAGTHLRGYGVPLPLWLDATRIKARDGGRVSATAVVTAIGASAILAEPGGQQSGRRWFSQESMDEVLDKAKLVPDPTYEGTAAGHARRNIALIVSDHGKAE